jgi:hypothetical protein
MRLGCTRIVFEKTNTVFFTLFYSYVGEILIFIRVREDFSVSVAERVHRMSKSRSLKHILTPWEWC